MTATDSAQACQDRSAAWIAPSRCEGRCGCGFLGQLTIRGRLHPHKRRYMPGQADAE